LPNELEETYQTDPPRNSSGRDLQIPLEKSSVETFHNHMKAFLCSWKRKEPKFIIHRKDLCTTCWYSYIAHMLVLI